MSEQPPRTVTTSQTLPVPSADDVLSSLTTATSIELPSSSLHSLHFVQAQANPPIESGIRCARERDGIGIVFPTTENASAVRPAHVHVGASLVSLRTTFPGLLS